MKIIIVIILAIICIYSFWRTRPSTLTFSEKQINTKTERWQEIQSASLNGLKRVIQVIDEKLETETDPEQRKQLLKIQSNARKTIMTHTAPMN